MSSVSNRPCILQAKIAEPSHAHTDTVEAAAMADRAAGKCGLPTECIPCCSSSDCCACGCAWQHAHKVIATRQGVQSYVYHLTSVQPAIVYQLQCQCGKLLQYDGLEDAVLNLNNVDLFSHELLKWCVWSCKHVMLAESYIAPTWYYKVVMLLQA